MEAREFYNKRIKEESTIGRFQLMEEKKNKIGHDITMELVCPICKGYNIESDTSYTPHWCKDCGAEYG